MTTPVAQLRAWRDEFAAQLPAHLADAACALLQRHRSAGDLCSIVTATGRFVSEPFALALDAPHLVATESEVVDGCFSGAIVGEHCFGDGKIAQCSAGWPVVDLLDAALALAPVGGGR